MWVGCMLWSLPLPMPQTQKQRAAMPCCNKQPCSTSCLLLKSAGLYHCLADIQKSEGTVAHVKMETECNGITVSALMRLVLASATMHMVQTSARTSINQTTALLPC